MIRLLIIVVLLCLVASLFVWTPEQVQSSITTKWREYREYREAKILEKYIKQGKIEMVADPPLDDATPTPGNPLLNL